MMRSIGLPELIALALLFVSPLVLLAWALRRRLARSVERAVIDKLPPEELAKLLATPQGARLLHGLGETPSASIIASVRRGIVMIATGVGIVVAGKLLGPVKAALTIGSILVFVGAGLLAAAYATYRLSKRWHLLEGNGDARRED